MLGYRSDQRCSSVEFVYASALDCNLSLYGFPILNNTNNPLPRDMQNTVLLFWPSLLLCTLFSLFQLPPQDHVVTVSENMQLYPPEHYLNGHLLEFDYDEEVGTSTL